MTGLPKDLIQNIDSKISISSFIETGTCYGDTAVWAAKKFKNVYTIEYSTVLFEKVIAQYGNIDNIEFIYGDSRDHLPKIINKASGPYLVWLDAHWSGSVTYGEGDECPLLQELAALEGISQEIVVLIDDARLFLSPPPKPHRIDHWPDIWQVIQALKKLPVDYVVVFEDVVIGVPESLRSTVEEHCQRRATEAWQNRKKESVSHYLKLAWRQWCKKIGLDGGSSD